MLDSVSTTLLALSCVELVLVQCLRKPPVVGSCWSASPLLSSALPPSSQQCRLMVGIDFLSGTLALWL